MWLVGFVVLLMIVLAIGFVGYLVQELGSSNAGGTGSPKSFVSRGGKSVEADAAFHAWISGDLRSMLSAVDKKTNEVDRHFLLMMIVKGCYKNRANPEMRAMGRQIGEKHLAEFPSIAPALRRDMGGTLPRVSTFQHLATILTDDGEFDRAVEVCRMAQEFGLHDGTKGGFEGRIGRIKKKRDRIGRDTNRGG